MGALRQLRDLLLAARKPLVICGGGGWTVQSAQALQRFAENWQLPVGCGFRFQDTFDNRHPLYAGDVGIGINPKLAARVREADLIIALGVRLGEMTTGGYTLFDLPVPIYHHHRLLAGQARPSPGAAIFCVVIGFNLLGEPLTDTGKFDVSKCI